MPAGASAREAVFAPAEQLKRRLTGRRANCVQQLATRADPCVVVGVRRRKWMIGAVTWLSVGVHAATRRRTGPPRGPFRLVTWNLRNFTGRSEATSAHARGHDLARLERTLTALDADVFCFQEVVEPAALMQRVRQVSDYTFAVSRHGGRSGQHLVTAWRAPVRSGGAASTAEALADGGHLRPALVVPLQVRAIAPCVWVVSVHLKAGRHGQDTRRRQWAALGQLVERLDRPRIVVGDFNTTGTRCGPESEVRELAAFLGPRGLERVAPSVLECTAYWEGTRRDPWKESSVLDHIFMDARPAARAVVTPGTLCRKHRCRAFVSTPAYPDLEYAHGSDHCPLVLDVGPVDIRPADVGRSTHARPQ